MCLVAGIDDRMRMAAAHHLALDEQRLLERRCMRRRLVVGVVAVHEQVAAGLQLAEHAGRRFDREAAGAGAGDERADDARAADCRLRTARQTDCMAHRRLTLRHRAQVLRAAVIGLHAGEAQAMRDDLLGERAGRGGRDAAAALADVDLDEHFDHAAGKLQRGREAFDAERRIDRDREPDSLRQFRHALELGRRDDFVADEDVGDAAVGQRLGLARLLHADADRTGADLQPRDRGALVHLRVRPQANAVGAGELGHSREVALHRVEVDDECRRIDRIDAIADLRCRSHRDVRPRCRPGRWSRRAPCRRDGRCRSSRPA